MKQGVESENCAMRAWHILACVALVQVVSTYAFSFPFSHESYKYEEHGGDLGRFVNEITYFNKCKFREYFNF